jgi:hypothetical protein
VSVRIRVFDSRIDAMHLPGGDVWNWAAGLKHEMEVLAKAKAPKRTGHLAESVSTSQGSNALGTFVTMGASAHYAAWVHEGTHGPIFPRGANYLKFRGQGVWAGGNSRDGYWRLPSVSGQRSQPFLRDAMEEVLARHRVV